MVSENVVPAAEQTDHAAVDALVNLSNYPASRHHSSVQMQTSAIHQLPPACGAKQLSKLKRFLTSMVQFGRDISNEVHDRVRLLILALVVSFLFSFFLILLLQKAIAE